MNRWSVWEWLVWLFGVTICIGLIMWFSYGVWGPKSPRAPFNPKEEFVKTCRNGSINNVVNVGNDNPNEWTCKRVD